MPSLFVVQMLWLGKRKRRKKTNRKKERKKIDRVERAASLGWRTA
jgi:hypothetical protein